jgi:hypothetical protein
MFQNRCTSYCKKQEINDGKKNPTPQLKSKQAQLQLLCYGAKLQTLTTKNPEKLTPPIYGD